ncbi:MAG TPA: CHAT domain-containing protein [Herpetosiphonaceae bacterium]
MSESTLDQPAALLARHRQRLYLLEQQAATYGLLVPTHVQLELAAVRDQIADLERAVAPQPVPPTPELAEDVVLIITAAEGGYLATARAPDGSSCQFPFVEPWSEDRISYLLYVLRTAARHTATVRSGQLHKAGINPQEVGLQLYHAVFGAELLALYQRARQAAAGRVRLRLHIEAPALARLPWELLHDGSDFLCLDRDTPLVRGVTVRPRQVAAEPVLRVLVIGGVARDEAPLRLDDELAVIERKLKPALERGEIQLHTLIGSNLERDLPSTLGSFRPHLVHVAGHGGLDGLRVPDADGRTRQISSATLRMLLRNVKSVQMVVLNGCELAANSDTQAGVATTLARVGIPTVVGMQFEISDTAAIAFAEGFYEALGWGWPAEEAVSWARSRMTYYAPDPDVMEWVTPAVYVASDDVRIEAVPVPGASPIAVEGAQEYTYQRLLELIWQNEFVIPTEQERLEKMRDDLGISAERAAALERTVRSTLAAIALGAAQQAQADGDVEEARSKYRRTLVLEPDNSVALTMMRRWNAWPDYLRPLSRENAHQLEEFWRLRSPGSIFATAWSPNGQYLAVATERGLSLYDIDTLQIQFKLSGASALYYSVAWSPDGRYVAAGSDNGKVRIWDLTDSREIASLQGPDSHIHGLEFGSGTPLSLAVGNHEGNLRVWEQVAGDQPSFHSGPVDLGGGDKPIYSVAWSPDGTLLAFGGADCKIHLCNLESGEHVRLEGHFDYVRRVAWSPDGTMLASSSGDQTICLWECDTKRLKTRLTGHVGWVRGLAWTPDGALVISGGFDEQVRIWDSASSALLRVLSGRAGMVNDLSMTPDGRVLASGSFDGVLTLWGVPPHNPADDAAP